MVLVLVLIVLAEVRRRRGIPLVVVVMGAEDFLVNDWFYYSFLGFVVAFYVVGICCGGCCPATFFGVYCLMLQLNY